MQITEIDENKQITSELHDLRKEYNAFAYIISHDLNANFRGIKTVADWFQQDYADVLDENGQELLGLLRDRVNRTQQMLETVLEFSRIGRVQNDYEILDTTQLVKYVINDFLPDVSFTCNNFEQQKWSANTTTSSGKSVQIDIGTLPSLYANEYRLVQLFTELIKNAFQHNSKDSIRLSIDEDSNDCFWILSITDNGNGIKDQYLPEIFDLFFTTKGDTQSHIGAGLAFAKKIIESHGGSIEIESEVGEFTTVTIRVPKNLDS